VERIGVLGGTFDPIHNGHLAAANEALRRLGLAKVLFAPAGNPWQKSNRRVSDVKLRCEMVRLAIESNPAFELSFVDVEHAGNSYTVDMLRGLRGCLGKAVELYFIAGVDAIRGIPSWHNAAGLAELATFVAVTRPGSYLDGPAIDALPVAVVCLEIPGVDVSSTQCRERLAAGLSLKGLVPQGVIDFILEHGLYRDGRAEPLARDSANTGQVTRQGEK
jgi:nicotinate-nucleotide adenylyltransferase